MTHLVKILTVEVERVTGKIKETIKEGYLR